jgi:hypothetical protein
MAYFLRWHFFSDDGLRVHGRLLGIWFVACEVVVLVFEGKTASRVARYATLEKE